MSQVADHRQPWPFVVRTPLLQYFLLFSYQHDRVNIIPSKTRIEATWLSKAAPDGFWKNLGRLKSLL